MQVSSPSKYETITPSFRRKLRSSEGKSESPLRGQPKESEISIDLTEILSDAEEDEVEVVSVDLADEEGNRNDKRKKRKRRKRKRPSSMGAQEPKDDDEVEGSEDQVEALDSKKQRNQDQPMAEESDEMTMINEVRVSWDCQDMPRPMKKYWAQRKRLFTLFDKGVRLDTEGWYSVTPEAIAVHIAERFRGLEPVCDAFCGVGGNTIQFAKVSGTNASQKSVIGVEIDPVRLRCAEWNAEVYDCADSIKFIKGDFIALAKSGKIKVRYLIWNEMPASKKFLTGILCFPFSSLGRTCIPRPRVLLSRRNSDRIPLESHSDN